MSAKNRADLITKLYKYVKKNYSVVLPPSNRPVMEHLLYGCCLENSTFEAADNTFAKLQENFFDWNEVRVTTVAELAETAKGLFNPQESGVSIKKTLHGVFEKYYQFDLDFLRKENLSKAVIAFESFKGVSPFVVSYIAQNGLGGHSIPLDRAMMNLFYVLGIVTEEEAKKSKVPGLERVIAKAKGVDFFVLAHQLAVEFASGPFRPAVREKLLKINPTAKERFPKRGGKKKEEPPKKEAKKAAPVVEVKEKKPAKTKKPAKAAKPEKKVAAKKKSAPKKAAPKKAAPKKAAPKKATPKKAAPKKVAKKAPAKKPAKKVTKAPAKKKATANKKSPNKRLSKKKPR